MKIVFFGDSVTEGVFELIDNCKDGFISVFDKQNVYHSVLIKNSRKLIQALNLLA